MFDHLFSSGKSKLTVNDGGLTASPHGSPFTKRTQIIKMKVEIFVMGVAMFLCHMTLNKKSHGTL